MTHKDPTNDDIAQWQDQTAKPQHTPGPWTAEDNGDGTHYITAGRGADIADTRAADNEPANAALIAAAPELLAACKAAKLAFRATSAKDKDYSHELGLLNAAIAHAAHTARC